MEFFTQILHRGKISDLPRDTASAVMRGYLFFPNANIYNYRLPR
jgi:hypothetical protein